MESAWNNLMSVGNKSIDAEHKLLLDMVSDIEGAIIERDSARLLKAFKLFEDAVDSHFRNEARIARAIDFPFEEHMLEHRYVLNELKSMRGELVSNAGRWPASAVEHYYGFLSKWATLHIDEDDMRMKAILSLMTSSRRNPRSRQHGCRIRHASGCESTAREIRMPAGVFHGPEKGNATHENSIFGGANEMGGRACNGVLPGLGDRRLGRTGCKTMRR